MIQTLIGLILLLMPFLLVNKFFDKRKGFFYVLSFLIFFHLITAIITQFFGIFNYWVVFFINIILCIGILIKTDYRKLTENLRKIKIDWILVFVLVVLIIELSSVHFNYAGKIADINGVREVKNMKYSYPYYSDEWSAVSFIKYSLMSGKLPFANSLWHNGYFPNPEFAFHSFLSELFLILDLNPLANYVLIALFTGILICFLVYFILKLNDIGKFISAVSALSIPYIVNSANLPGIWYLIPIILGIICLLLNFVFISFKDSRMVLFTSFLTLLFYPPLFVLSFFSLIFYFIFLDINRKDKIRYMASYFLICFIVAAIISFKLVFRSYAGFDAFNYIISKIFYFTFTKESIPDYSIWKVIPLWSLIFSIFGFIKILSEEFLIPKNPSKDFFGIGTLRRKELGKKSWLIAPILVGLGYWLIYSFVFWRFIIEYQRIVVVSSVLIVLFSGFGIEYFINYLINKNLISKKFINLVFILIFTGFLISSFYYTQKDNWSNLKLYNIDGQIANPAPPANNYLTQEDLDLFKDIWGRVFIAPPWKGLVIGTVRNSYPLESKQSTITNSILKYNEFINSNCSTKLKLVKKYKISYAYSSEFNCTGFRFIGKSSEGLFLYEVKV